MFDRASQIRHKEALAVRITLAGQPSFDAFVFVKIEERLTDLMNDARAFLPVRRADGSSLIVAKSSIADIVELAALAGAETASPPPPPTEPQTEARPEEPPSAPGSGTSQQDAAGAEAKNADSDGAPREERASAGPAGDQNEPPPRPARARKALDPYALLRVPRTATLEEIKKAYKQRIKAVHPDTIASLDLDEDIARAVNLTAQRINQAYERILRDFQRAAEERLAQEAGAAEEGRPTPDAGQEGAA